MARSCVVVAFTLMVGCPKKEAPPEPAAPAKDTPKPSDPAGVAPEPEPPTDFTVRAIEVPAANLAQASALMKWVMPLGEEVEPECSATAITRYELLTAAHCVDGTQPPKVKINNVGESIVDARRRACAHTPDQSCLPAFPVKNYSMFQYDVATVSVPTPLPTGAPTLGRVEGFMPHAFMLSTRAKKPMVICRSHVSFGTGTAPGAISDGDSGSPIVAFRPDGTVVILGVVSHRADVSASWWFAPLANPIPWPLAAMSTRPSVSRYDRNDFTAIQECP